MWWEQGGRAGGESWAVRAGRAAAATLPCWDPPCSLLPLPAHLLPPVPFPALWGRDCLSPCETRTATAPNVTAPRGPVGAVLMQTSVFFLPEAPSGPAKPRLVDCVLTRESPAMVLRPGSDAHKILHL